MNCFPIELRLSLTFFLPNQKCQKILIEKMTYSEICKILSFEKSKLITTKLLCPQQNDSIIVTNSAK